MADPKLQFVTTDVFTRKRYEGNPLAIVRCPASVKLTQAQKQHMAHEFNLSETVILHESEESYRKNEWTFDIFITSAEINFAGHPTIGTVCYLGRSLQARGAGGVIEGTLICKAGPLAFTYDTAAQHATAAIPHDSHLHDRTLSAQDTLSFNIHEAVFKAMPNPAAFVSIVKGMTFCLVEVTSLEALSSVETGLKSIERDGLNKEYAGDGVLAFLFYCPQSEDDGVTRLRTRMIGESLEDPATGSASSALCVYLTLHHPKSGKSGKSGRQSKKFELTQGVEMGRKSIIGVEVAIDDSSQVEKVVLSGSAVEIMEGAITVPE